MNISQSIEINIRYLWGHLPQTGVFLTNIWKLYWQWARYCRKSSIRCQNNLISFEIYPVLPSFLIKLLGMFHECVLWFHSNPRTLFPLMHLQCIRFDCWVTELIWSSYNSKNPISVLFWTKKLQLMRVLKRNNGSRGMSMCLSLAVVWIRGSISATIWLPPLKRFHEQGVTNGFLFLFERAL